MSKTRDKFENLRLVEWFDHKPLEWRKYTEECLEEIARLRRDLSIEANESRNLQHEVFNLENECAGLKDLLKHSKCGNNKCKDGSIPHQEYPSGDWVADQCEWCYRVNKIKTQDNE